MARRWKETSFVGSSQDWQVPFDFGLEESHRRGTEQMHPARSRNSRTAHHSSNKQKTISSPLTSSLDYLSYPSNEEETEISMTECEDISILEGNQLIPVASYKRDIIYKQGGMKRAESLSAFSAAGTVRNANSRESAQVSGWQQGHFLLSNAGSESSLYSMRTASRRVVYDTQQISRNHNIHHGHETRGFRQEQKPKQTSTSYLKEYDSGNVYEDYATGHIYDEIQLPDSLDTDKIPKVHKKDASFENTGKPQVKRDVRDIIRSHKENITTRITNNDNQSDLDKEHLLKGNSNKNNNETEITRQEKAQTKDYLTTKEDLGCPNRIRGSYRNMIEALDDTDSSKNSSDFSETDDTSFTENEYHINDAELNYGSLRRGLNVNKDFTTDEELDRTLPKATEKKPYLETNLDDILWLPYPPKTETTVTLSQSDRDKINKSYKEDLQKPPVSKPKVLSASIKRPKCSPPQPPEKITDDEQPSKLAANPERAALVNNAKHFEDRDHKRGTNNLPKLHDDKVTPNEESMYMNIKTIPGNKIARTANGTGKSYSDHCHSREHHQNKGLHRDEKLISEESLYMNVGELSGKDNATPVMKNLQEIKVKSLPVEMLYTNLEELSGKVQGLETNMKKTPQEKKSHPDESIYMNISRSSEKDSTSKTKNPVMETLLRKEETLPSDVSVYMNLENSLGKVCASDINNSAMINRQEKEVKNLTEESVYMNLGTVSRNAGVSETSIKKNSRENDSSQEESIYINKSKFSETDTSSETSIEVMKSLKVNTENSNGEESIYMNLGEVSGNFRASASSIPIMNDLKEKMYCEEENSYPEESIYMNVGNLSRTATTSESNNSIEEKSLKVEKDNSDAEDTIYMNLEEVPGIHRTSESSIPVVNNLMENVQYIEENSYPEESIYMNVGNMSRTATTSESNNSIGEKSLKVEKDMNLEEVARIHRTSESSIPGVNNLMENVHYVEENSYPEESIYMNLGNLPRTANSSETSIPVEKSLQVEKEMSNAKDLGKIAGNYRAYECSIPVMKNVKGKSCYEEENSYVDESFYMNTENLSGKQKMSEDNIDIFKTSEPQKEDIWKSSYEETETEKGSLREESIYMNLENLLEDNGINKDKNLEYTLLTKENDTDDKFSETSSYRSKSTPQPMSSDDETISTKHENNLHLKHKPKHVLCDNENMEENYSKTANESIHQHSDNSEGHVKSLPMKKVRETEVSVSPEINQNIPENPKTEIDYHTEYLPDLTFNIDEPPSYPPPPPPPDSEASETYSVHSDMFFSDQERMTSPTTPPPRPPSPLDYAGEPLSPSLCHSSVDPEYMVTSDFTLDSLSEQEVEITGYISPKSSECDLRGSPSPPPIPPRPKNMGEFGYNLSAIRLFKDDHIYENVREHQNLHVSAETYSEENTYGNIDYVQIAKEEAKYFSEMVNESIYENPYEQQEENNAEESIYVNMTKSESGRNMEDGDSANIPHDNIKESLFYSETRKDRKDKTGDEVNIKSSDMSHARPQKHDKPLQHQNVYDAFDEYDPGHIYEIISQGNNDDSYDGEDISYHKNKSHKLMCSIPGISIPGEDEAYYKSKTDESSYHMISKNIKCHNVHEYLADEEIYENMDNLSLDRNNTEDQSSSPNIDNIYENMTFFRGKPKVSDEEKLKETSKDLRANEDDELMHADAGHIPFESFTGDWNECPDSSEERPPTPPPRRRPVLQRVFPRPRCPSPPPSPPESPFIENSREILAFTSAIPEMSEILEETPPARPPVPKNYHLPTIKALPSRPRHPPPPPPSFGSMEEESGETETQYDHKREIQRFLLEQKERHRNQLQRKQESQEQGKGWSKVLILKINGVIRKSEYCYPVFTEKATSKLTSKLREKLRHTICEIDHPH
ncbi:hypothetical protein SK128_010518 [Halocaridina rubra]|uniref:Uncharacterized protein n=1 Tax=Halocaridina rubra TaxID=373956 RepID=A0AAN9AD20_HALRR